MIKPWNDKTTGLSLSLLILALTPCLIWADTTSPTTQPASKPHFVLKAEDHVLSLQATHASLKDILHEMGRHMNMVVVTRMPDQAITTSFNRLTVPEALKHLKVNAIYFQRTEGEHQRITKIIALQRGESTRQPSQASMPRQAPGPEPFQFEFDPRQAEHKTRSD